MDPFEFYQPLKIAGGGPAAGKRLQCTDASGNSIWGPSQWPWLVAAKTANYTITEADTGTLFTNEGAPSGTITLTLPAASAGLRYAFYIQTDGGGGSKRIRVQTQSGDTIRLGTGGAGNPGGYMEYSVTGSCSILIAINSTEWWALFSIGTASLS